MAYNESLASRVRDRLADIPKVTEKAMFGGLAFMVNDKMCICIAADGLMCRIDPLLFEELTCKHGVQPMVMKGREMKSYYWWMKMLLQAIKSFSFG